MVKDIKKRSPNYYEGSVDSARWGKNLTLACTAMDQFPYAEKCLNYLDSLPDEVEKKLIRCIFRYYKKMMEFYTEEDIEDLSRFFEEMKGLASVTEETVLNRVRFGTIIVDEDCRQDRIEFHMECSCDWEIEHGLEITISDGKILYVGPFEDNPPYSKSLEPDRAEKDEWNFAVSHTEAE